MISERGSVSIVVAAAVAFGALLAAFSADVTRVVTARARAQTAADAAALAAAQELIAPSGRGPEELAGEYAARHGAVVVDCECEPGADEVVVTVSLEVGLPYLDQTRALHTAARAVVAVPAGAEGLQPYFIARLSCLLARVPGLWIISGFRTRAEQAELYEQKPGLAAPPGHSNHEVGLAADLGYPSEAEEQAAHREAPGCRLEFPMTYEPWHVEPVEL
ncbi:MAG: M15 family metallopeptidase [Actinomycetota bacterium]|nr:M15 family metallopeptidase [Actinomycetota bacterium]